MEKEDEKLPKAFHEKLKGSGSVIREEEMDQLLNYFKKITLLAIFRMKSF